MMIPNESMILSVITGCSLLFGIFSGLVGLRKSTRSEAGKHASEMMMVIVKLEDISVGITEIKSDLSNVKGDIRELTERLIVAEQAIKQAHRRLDDLQKHDTLK